MSLNVLGVGFAHTCRICRWFVLITILAFKWVIKQVFRYFNTLRYASSAWKLLKIMDWHYSNSFIVSTFTSC